MFGGVAFLLDGNLLADVWKDSLIARLGGEQGGEALLDPHVRPFDVTGKPMWGWVLVGPRGGGRRRAAVRLDRSVRLPGVVLAFEAISGLPNERLTIRHDAGSGSEPYVGGTLLARGLDRLLLGTCPDLDSCHTWVCSRSVTVHYDTRWPPTPTRRVTGGASSTPAWCSGSGRRTPPAGKRRSRSPRAASGR
jgi:hypothetical protein